jgi:hypothetical protein
MDGLDLLFFLHFLYSHNYQTKNSLSLLFVHANFILFSSLIYSHPCIIFIPHMISHLVLKWQVQSTLKVFGKIVWEPLVFWKKYSIISYIHTYIHTYIHILKWWAQKFKLETFAFTQFLKGKKASDSFFFIF